MITASPRVGYRSLLRNRLFLRLWLAQLISQTIQNAANYGLLVLIAETTGSSTLIGLGIIAFSLPAVLFAAPAGVLVDRINRRQVLWMSNLLRGLFAFGFVVSLMIDRADVVPIYLLTFLIAVVSQFFTPAEGAAIPLVVDERELVNALSLFNITFTLSQALGFILLGPVILNVVSPVTMQINGTHITFDAVQVLYLVIGLTYLLCAALILWLPNRQFELERNGVQGASSLERVKKVVAEIGESWRFVYRDRRLLIAVLQLSFGSIILLVIGQLAPKFVQQMLHRPPANAALVFVPAGVGLVLGSAVMPRVVKRLGKARSISAGIIGVSVTSVLLVVCQRIARQVDPQHWFNNTVFLALILALVFALGCELGLMTIPAQTVMQERTPDAIKGRVLALQMMVYNAVSIPVILFMGGIADIYDIAVVMGVLAVTVFVGGLFSVYLDSRVPDAALDREGKPSLSNEPVEYQERELEPLMQHGERMKRLSMSRRVESA
jgi:MFS family permease